MGFKRKYTRTANPAIASYTYTDIADGTGVQKFYGAKISGGWLLTPQAIYSEKLFSLVTPNGTSGTILLADFETTFNLPKTVKGNMVINAPIMHDTSSDGLRTVNVTVNVYRVSSGTATNIGMEKAVVYSESGTGQTPVNDRVRIVNIPLTQTHFKKGDTLRINVREEAYNANGSCIFYGYHDPAGRSTTSPTITDGTIPTKLEFYVPFKIDL